MTVNINAANISSVQLAAAQTPSAPNSGFVRLHHNANSRLAMRPATGNVVEFLGNTSGSGAGITFPNSASTNASTLDWYEETTWTPVVEGAGTAGTMGGVIVQVGFATRIGRMVFAQGYVSYGTHTGSGAMRITGLPFTSNNSTEGRSPGHLIPRNMNWSGGTQMKVWLAGNSNILLVYGLNDDADWTAQQIVNESTDMAIQITYMV